MSNKKVKKTPTTSELNAALQRVATMSDNQTRHIARLNDLVASQALEIQELRGQNQSLRELAESQKTELDNFEDGMKEAQDEPIHFVPTNKTEDQPKK